MTTNNNRPASLETIQDDFNHLEQEWKTKNGTKEGFAEWFVSQMLKAGK